MTSRWIMRAADFERVIGCIRNVGSGHEDMPYADGFVDTRIEIVAPDRIHEVVFAVNEKADGGRLGGIEREVPGLGGLDPARAKRCGRALNLGPGVQSNYAVHHLI